MCTFKNAFVCRISIDVCFNKIMSVIKTGMMYAAFGGVLGFVIGAGKETSGSKKKHEWETEYMYLSRDSDAITLCEELLLDIKDPVVKKLASNLNKIVAIRDRVADTTKTLKLSSNSTAQLFRSRAVDALRTLSHNCVYTEDLLASTQKFIDNAMFNIAMDISARLDA